MYMYVYIYRNFYDYNTILYPGRNIHRYAGSLTVHARIDEDVSGHQK